MIHLHEITKKDAAPAFGGFDNVPSSAITMGVGTIMKAKRIILMAWGANKADIIQRTVEGEMSDQVPATSRRIPTASSCSMRPLRPVWRAAKNKHEL